MTFDEAESVERVWQLAHPALRATLDAGRALIDSGQYFPRLGMPRADINDAGWPSGTYRPRSLADEDSPPDWSGLVGLDASLSPIKAQDISVLNSFIEEMAELARTNSFARALFDPNVDDTDDDITRQFRKISALLLVEQVAGRIEALRLHSDSELRTVFDQYVSGRTDRSHKGTLIVPLLLTKIDLDEPIRLADKITVAPLTAKQNVSRGFTTEFVEKNPNLLAAATHAIFISDAPIATSDWGYLDYQSIDLTEVKQIVECVQLASDGTSGFGQVLVEAHGWATRWHHDLPPIYGSEVKGQYPDEFNDLGWLKPAKSHLSEIQARELLPKFYRNLSTAKPNIKLAARRARNCDLRTDDDDFLLDAAIGLEALLGDRSDELTHRLAQRAAVALVGRLDAKSAYSAVKQIYAARSKIVHGSELSKRSIVVNGEKYSTRHTAKFLLEELLRSWLSGDTWTPAELDNRLLQALPSSGTQAPAEN